MVYPQIMPMRARALKCKPFPGAAAQWEAGLTKSYNGGNWMDVVGGVSLPPVTSNEPVFNFTPGNPAASFTLGSSKRFQSTGQPTGIIANLHKGTLDFTIAAIIRTGGGATQIAVDTRGTIPAAAGWNIYALSGETTITFAARRAAAVITKTTAKMAIGAAGGEVPWNLYVWSFNAATNTMYAYKNGVLEATVTAFFTSTTTEDVAATSRITIGTLGDGSNTANREVQSLMVSGQFYADIQPILDYYTNLHRHIQADATVYTQQRYYKGTGATHPVVGIGQSNMEKSSIKMPPPSAHSIMLWRLMPCAILVSVARRF